MTGSAFQAEWLASGVRLVGRRLRELLATSPARREVPVTPSVGLSVVLGSYNRRAFLEKTIASVRSNGIRVSYEIIVVDGGSTDGSLEWLIGQKDLITIVQHNRGQFHGRPLTRRSWGYFMNLGFKCAQGNYVLMLSDDCLLLPGAVNAGLETAEALAAEGRRIGGVAFYYRDWPEEREYYVQLTLGGKLMVNHGLFVRRALEEVGWADENRYIFYKADGDLCLRMWQAGYEIVDCPRAYVEHYVPAGDALRESNTEALAHDRQAYLDRWTGVFYDPGRADQRGRISLTFDDPDRVAERFLTPVPDEG
jgi:GT2 family glycosyltransferase